MADIRNKEYQANGRTTASDYRFQFEDADFDFIFLTSVFSHMLPSEVENYLLEISRLLKPGGHCLITNADVPEEAIAHPESMVTMSYKKFVLDKDMKLH